MKYPLSGWENHLPVRNSHVPFLSACLVWGLVFSFLGCGVQRAAQPPPTGEIPGHETPEAALHSQIASLNKQYEDVENRVVENRQRIEILEKELVSLRQTLTDKKAEDRGPIDQSGKGLSPQDLKTTFPNATMLYRAAFEAYFFQENYPVAISLFQEFLSTFPPNDLTDNALYWMGESYYAHKDFERAIPSFLKLVEGYPHSSTVPEALLKIGLSYSHLSNPRKAREFLTRVMDEYPFSEAAKEAKARLNRQD